MTIACLIPPFTHCICSKCWLLSEHECSSLSGVIVVAACNVGNGLTGTGITGIGSPAGCMTTCPVGTPNGLAGQPAPGSNCAAGQTFSLVAATTPGVTCPTGVPMCCFCIGTATPSPPPPPVAAAVVVASPATPITRRLPATPITPRLPATSITRREPTSPRHSSTQAGPSGCAQDCTSSCTKGRACSSSRPRRQQE